MEQIKLWWNGKSTSAKTLNFIARHSLWVLGIVIALWITHFAIEKVDTILDIITFESVAIALSGIAVFAFTRIKWHATTDSDLTTLGRHIVMAMIFVAVHLVVLGVVIGSLYVNTDKVIVEKKQTKIDSIKAAQTLPKLDTLILREKK